MFKRRAIWTGLVGIALMALFVGWVTNPEVSLSLARRRDCYQLIKRDGATLRKEGTWVAGRNGVVVNRTLRASGTSLTITGTSVRSPPYGARLRARLDANNSNETTTSMTCDLVLYGTDPYGRQQNETIAVTEPIGGVMSARVWRELTSASASNCTGFSPLAATAANGRLRVWTSTVVALPMPINPGTRSKIGATINSALMSITRQDGTNLDVLYSTSGAAGVNHTGTYDSTTINTALSTANMNVADITNGNTFCFDVAGPNQAAPVGLAPR